jgi:hypothetical protein
LLGREWNAIGTDGIPSGHHQKNGTAKHDEHKKRTKLVKKRPEDWFGGPKTFFII